MLGVSQTVPAMQGTQGKGAGEQHSRSRQKGCEHTTDPAQRSAQNPPVQTGCATATHRPGPFLILGGAQAPHSQPSSGPDTAWMADSGQGAPCQRSHGSALPKGYTEMYPDLCSQGWDCHMLARGTATRGETRGAASTTC